MKNMRETILLILALLSADAWGATTTKKQIDTIANSTGGSSLSVPSVGSTLDTDSNTLTLSNKSISGSSNTITNVSLTAGVTGILPAANGGTGLATLTANNVILGNGTSTVLFVAPGTSGNVLTSNGSTWQSTAAAGGSVTPRYIQVSMNTSSTIYWSTTSTSFASPTHVGTTTLTTWGNANFPAVTQNGNNVGLSFTPDHTGNLKITVTASILLNTASANCAIFNNQGGAQLGAAGGLFNGSNASNNQWMFTMTAYVATTSGTLILPDLRCKTSANTVYVGGEDGTDAGVVWNMEYLN